MLAHNSVRPSRLAAGLLQPKISMQMTAKYALLARGDLGEVTISMGKQTQCCYIKIVYNVHLKAAISIASLTKYFLPQQILGRIDVN